MNSVGVNLHGYYSKLVNLHGYYSKLVNLHNYVLTDVSHFQAKLCKFYTFLYYTPTDLSALSQQRQAKHTRYNTCNST